MTPTKNTPGTGIPYQTYPCNLCPKKKGTLGGSQSRETGRLSSYGVRPLDHWGLHAISCGNIITPIEHYDTRGEIKHLNNEFFAIRVIEHSWWQQSSRAKS